MVPQYNMRDSVESDGDHHLSLPPSSNYRKKNNSSKPKPNNEIRATEEHKAKDRNEETHIDVSTRLQLKETAASVEKDIGDIDVEINKLKAQLEKAALSHTQQVLADLMESALQTHNHNHTSSPSHLHLPSTM